MAEETIERESMEFDVVIVGAGPAGLCAAIRIKQLDEEKGTETSVVVVEKGSEVGAHILSGAVVDPKALNELIPDWKEQGCPLETEVTEESFLVMGPAGSLPLPVFAMPSMVKNHGCYIASMGNVCRWLAEKAEGMGVEIYPMMAASKYLKREDGSVSGVVVGEVGIGKDGEKKGSYEPGMELHGKYVLLGEGVRGSLSKEIIAEFGLDSESDPQKYGIGLKELWKVPDENFKPGYVQHTFGWPLDNDTGGGSWCYHFGDNYVSIGFVVHLNYKNPYLSPYQEFQRFKTHPDIAKMLEGGERVAYGSRAITEGGFQSIPKLTFPGGALIGCSAGFVNVPRIKGNHNAMKTGMMAAEAAWDALQGGRAGDELEAYTEKFYSSWVHDELKKVRNAKPLWTKYGTLLGGIALSGADLWLNQLTGGWSPFGTMRHDKTDAAATEPASKHKPIAYPKPDGTLTFDRLTNVSFSFTNHEEDQPAHLKLLDPSVPVDVNLPTYAGPSQRYCPAGVYEYVEEGGETKFQINAQNCVHCKTCDIKDPQQNIKWTVPEGGGGPNYPNM
ncbi:electron transfer flavoprotein-ubiquinone oxidoreductase [Parvularcula flava]|uniref:Electron transfer flavoprotein-ubiquinone oxidoreductase n=1 Tax=Aquisalinus luteolus TaxID=1566827 RepID=A0A8J3A335_9PROT|nr:electron transfer flavoprotein-ubiquinone oxidoreductase [Aquisalinus luteolus]NHK28757.1 electron transfer flavoprotein-ubiquinone oxidoreductase [Aquisalinus luteolus]GGH99428.1 electron transfer flavoprotein-ubiquinone oxidoreductase [Aquisalinus luteolus]